MRLPHEPRPPRRLSGAPDRLGLRDRDRLEMMLREVWETGGLSEEWTTPQPCGSVMP